MRGVTEMNSLLSYALVFAFGFLAGAGVSEIWKEAKESIVIK